MKPPATIILEEVCGLISAQLEMLENAETLTYPELFEYHGRAQKITELCEELNVVSTCETAVTEDDWSESVA